MLGLRRTVLLFTLTSLLLLTFLPAYAADWPSRSINIIVPWNPGGASDLTARTLAVQMEKVLGRRISITNTPGGSGAIGTQAMFDASRDGYTWSGNADGSIATYQSLEYLKKSHKDYTSFLAIFTPNVVCVPANSPYQDFPALLAAMQQGTVTVASAGVGSGGHQAAEFFKKYTNVNYRHVPYQGGAPAVTATVRGEVEAVMQLSMEVTEMLRAKQLKALAVMDVEPLEVDGYGVIPSITQWIPDFPSVGARFGLFIPADVPQDALAKIGQAFEKAANSAEVKKFARERGSKAICLYGPEADTILDQVASRISWMLFEAGVAKTSPATFGIAKPQ